ISRHSQTSLLFDLECRAILSGIRFPNHWLDRCSNGTNYRVPDCPNAARNSITDSCLITGKFRDAVETDRCGPQKQESSFKRPPSPGGIRDAGHRAQTSSQCGNPVWSRNSCGPWVVILEKAAESLSTSNR